MQAVKEVAGTGSGLNVVDKAAQARSTLKVLQALSNISNLLKVSARAPSCLPCVTNALLLSCCQFAASIT